MSQSRQLQVRITQMEEIRSILNSMKNLALIEIHKLTRFQNTQRQSVDLIEQTATDYLAFYPGFPKTSVQTRTIALIVGAERGFCGDFNESLLTTMAAQNYTGIIALGTRLHHRLEGHSLQLIEAIPGANVAEEIPEVLARVIDVLGQQHSEHQTLSLTVIHHDPLPNHINVRQIMPPFEHCQPTKTGGHPPLLNLEPADFFAELIDHYLFAVLHEILYLSLMAENHRRLQHLEAAIKHLDDHVVSLRRKSQIYRQEEITEEIEVILLNTENSLTTNR